MNLVPPPIFRLLLALPLLFGAAAPAAVDGAAIADTISRRGDAIVAAYRPEHRLDTAAEFSELYFGVFEAAGMELDLGARAPGLKAELEVLFGAINGKAMAGVPPAELQLAWHDLRARLQEAGALYGQKEAGGFWPTFVKSLLILLREGAEAMLVVSALAAYLRRAGAADRIWVLHAGVATAIPLSLVTGWALTGSIQAAGASRSLLEGLAMLAAAVMLIYISFWLFSKRETKRWQAWVAGQVGDAVSGGSLLALGATACLAVYREGAETVLFYVALDAAAPGQGQALTTGAGAAVALLIALYFGLGRLALRLPYGLFFGATAALLYGLAVVFAGQALVELQAAGWLTSHYLQGFPHVAWLGLAPTLHSVVGQGVLLLLPALAWLLHRRRFLIPVS